MTTWDEVLGQLRRHYRLDMVGDGWCLINWRFGSTAGDRIVQRQVIRRDERLGRVWLQVLCDIGRGEDIPHRLALELGADLAVGSVTLVGDRYYLSQRILLDGLTASALQATIGTMAGQATALTGRFRGMDESAPFGHYGE